MTTCSCPIVSFAPCLRQRLPACCWHYVRGRRPAAAEDGIFSDVRRPTSDVRRPRDARASLFVGDEARDAGLKAKVGVGAWETRHVRPTATAIAIAIVT
ncbi:uncharacterized protein UV8b_02116 [Ustilaginoidea virens]|uniref:Uncharacterized protein n=1 Tax=Ustilaginoidea virens TaxID=1159556 RepID=A0A8E5HLV7_USTVR|nr:uncharacterized protein UV8b_02116 [Ustilaginoidea virens]QUC17875.1 hypothetical protein UV8b_02116 [Ustilaginoidea virens]